METVSLERTDGRQPATGERPAATTLPNDTAEKIQIEDDR